jgi:thioredoxin-like negative regulator of GroEL
MSPSVAQVAAQHSKDVELVRIDVSIDRTTAAQYLVYGIPTLVAVLDDKVLGRSVGSATPDQIDRFFSDTRSRSVRRARLTTGERALRLGVAAAIGGIGIASAQAVVVVGALGFVAYAFTDRLPRFNG